MQAIKCVVVGDGWVIVLLKLGVLGSQSAILGVFGVSSRGWGDHDVEPEGWVVGLGSVAEAQFLAVSQVSKLIATGLAWG